MTRLRTFCLPILLVGMALSLGSVARAGTIYDNLGAASDGADSVFLFGPLADSFSTGAASSLVDVKLLLGADAPTDGGVTTVSLLSDASTSPGAVIATLGTISDSSLTPALSVVDLSSFAPVALAANTRYWIELSQPNGGSAFWSWSFDTTGPGVAGEFFSNANGVFDNSDGPYQMQINVTSVPEPSAVVLGVIGIGGLFVLRRRAIR